ncbi:TIGR01777 family oxidoreductase [Arcicella sp. LKC2W]|uniref:TIGR01777 family oxidoreductase n=1 Tax=Arcicella sp. LKC2W TaxID=2984198 RepID=UPI002B209F3A|nr:TIGR01777 family oxidoreductase [Arcicella sp. LKC2W]MEA5457770.1 TIGR01777 family oxidoreductase [Arcicella sp. LKC2W]
MNVLITGGSGLVGTRLTEILIAKGFTVSHLSRKPSSANGKIQTFHWDIEKGIIDEKAIEEADYLVHLAGAGIADENWSEARKREIIESRTKSIQLITNKLKTIPHKIKSFVSASGIGFYGANTGDEHISEQHTAGIDFVADCCIQWEAAADEIQNLGIRTVKLRTGIVLSEKGGALPRIIQPVRWGVGAALGTGKQWQSWIHLDDLCELYVKSLTDNSMKGFYNAVAPNPVTNYDLTKLSAEVLKRPFWMPNVPAFALKLVFGEMASIVLGGNYVLNQRIKLETDFRYKFTDAKTALEDLLK